jgi:cell division protease FtsH
LAARRDKPLVTQTEFEAAKERVMMGPERKSLVMTEEEKRLTAYHEGGHAIVALSVKAADPVHKATITARGRIIGAVLQLPQHDKLSMNREQMTARLTVLMGGRCAEEVVFGRDKVTSSAASDIEQATRLARMMVMQWGLSDALGVISYGGDTQAEVLLGYPTRRQRNMSQATAQAIDVEICRLVNEAHETAKQILAGRRRDLDVLAGELLAFETLTGNEIRALLDCAGAAGETIRSSRFGEKGPAGPSAGLPDDRDNA